MAMQYDLDPPIQNTMGGANLHTPQSIFQHMMGQQNSPQQGGPWLQMPQVPTLSIPWSVSAMQQPDLIRFTGERRHPAYGVASLHHKRKLSTPDITDTRQTKQFITEEKMASHFQELHISSNYQREQCRSSTSADCGSISSTCGTSQYINSGMESTEALEIDQNDHSEPRLVISEELKRFQEEPLIPASLLSKLERPSMALVLWEPPSKHLVRVWPTPRNTPTPVSTLVEDGNNNNNINNNNNSNNNNNNNIDNDNNNDDDDDDDVIIDLNQSSAQLEPMEL